MLQFPKREFHRMGFRYSYSHSDSRSVVVSRILGLPNRIIQDMGHFRSTFVHSSSGWPGPIPLYQVAKQGKAADAEASLLLSELTFRIDCRFEALPGSDSVSYLLDRIETPMLLHNLPLWHFFDCRKLYHSNHRIGESRLAEIDFTALPEMIIRLNVWSNRLLPSSQKIIRG